MKLLLISLSSFLIVHLGLAQTTLDDQPCSGPATPVVPISGPACSGPGPSYTTSGLLLQTNAANGGAVPCAVPGVVSQDGWFSFVAPPSGLIDFNIYLTQGHAIGFYVYSVNCATSTFTFQFCDAYLLMAPGTEQSNPWPPLTPGATYYVRVNNFAISNPGLNGTVRFNVCMNEIIPLGVDNVQLTANATEEELQFSIDGSVTHNDSLQLLESTNGYSWQVVHVFYTADSIVHTSVTLPPRCADSMYYYKVQSTTADEVVTSNVVSLMGKKQCIVRGYPNPVTAEFHVPISIRNIENVRVLDNLGRNVETTVTVSETELTVYATHLKEGSYRVFYQENNSLQHTQFIKLP